MSGSPVLSIRLGLAAAGTLVASFLVPTAPALADLRVCNETRNLVSIALGYRAERGWMSEGWWQAPPGDCRILFQGNLERRFYYIYAVDDIGGGAWDGQVFMCTRDESFTIFGVEDCLARGYERTGFFEIDTQSRSDWTVQLTEQNLLEGISADPGESDLLDDPDAAGPDAPLEPDAPDTSLD